MTHALFFAAGLLAPLAVRWLVDVILPGWERRRAQRTARP